jgi:hypothetical protein
MQQCISWLQMTQKTSRILCLENTQVFNVLLYFDFHLMILKSTYSKISTSASEPGRHLEAKKTCALAVNQHIRNTSNTYLQCVMHQCWL